MHLTARIVDIIFGIHRIACPAQQTGQAVSYGSTATVPHMQRAGGIGRNVFHQHFLAAPVLAVAVGHACGLHLLHGLPPEGLTEGDIAEARPGGFGPDDVRAECGQAFCQFLRQVARPGLGRFGQQHGRIGGEIAVTGVTRGFNDKFFRPGQAFFFQYGRNGLAQNVDGAHGKPQGVAG